MSFPRAAVDALAAGGTETPDYHVYGGADGLRTVEFGGGNTSPGCRTPDGMLWFPSVRGIVKVDPDHIVTNNLPPPVRIEQATVDGTSLALTDGIEIAPGAQHWEFQYTGLSLLVPQRSQFRYQLEGFDHGWVDANSRRTAYYTGLSPGTYTFRVMARNNDGVWSENDAALRFTLKPHLYQTLWFKLLCAMGLVLAAGGLYRLRVGRLRGIAGELGQQVALRTRDLEFGQRGAPASQGACGARRPGQVGVSGQHEPRNPHAHERRDRHDRTAAGDESDARAARIPGDGPTVGRALLTIINDILDFSKIEAGKLELERIDFDLRDTLEMSLRLLALHGRTAKGSSCRLPCDPPRARRRPAIPAGCGRCCSTSWQRDQVHATGRGISST